MYSIFYNISARFFFRIPISEERFFIFIVSVSYQFFTGRCVVSLAKGASIAGRDVCIGTFGIVVDYDNATTPAGVEVL